MSQEITGIAAQCQSLEDLCRRSESAPNREKLEKQIADLLSEQAKLTAKRDALQNEYTPRLRLYNACSEFLRQNGIRV